MLFFFVHKFPFHFSNHITSLEVAVSLLLSTSFQVSIKCFRNRHFPNPGPEPRSITVQNVPLPSVSPHSPPQLIVIIVNIVQFV